MAKCSYCGSTILFGGVRDSDLRFCNDVCHEAGSLLNLSHHIPENQVQQQVWEVHQGLCPKCRGRGPIDVHVNHEVWSAVFMTRWKSSPQISCRSCATKAQLASTTFSFFLGWWGLPWGLIMTPVQVSRNVAGIFHGPDPSKPSPELENLIRVQLAVAVVEQSQAQTGDQHGETDG